MNYNVFKRIGISVALFMAVVLCLQLFGVYLFVIGFAGKFMTFLAPVLFFTIEYIFINFLKNCIKMSYDKNLYLGIEVLTMILSPFLVVQFIEFILPINVTAFGVLILIIITLAVNFKIQFSMNKESN